MQQRLLHRQNFEFPETQPTVEELSVDGGNIRIRTPIEQLCDWKGYKAVRLHITFCVFPKKRYHISLVFSVGVACRRHRRTFRSTECDLFLPTYLVHTHCTGSN